MHSEVTVTFPNSPPRHLDLNEVQPMPHDVARLWLDEQFTLMGCEPLRPTGKLLTADKVLVWRRQPGRSSLPIPHGHRPLPAPPAPRWPDR